MERRERKTNLTEEEQRLKERLMRVGNPVRRKGSGKVSEEFWKLPWPEDPEGMARRYLIEDRREGR